MTILLVLLCSLTVVTALAARVVGGELTAQSESIRRKQLADMAWGTLKCALLLEQRESLRDEALPEVLLYPGNQPVRAEWNVKHNPLAGWRHLQVKVRTDAQSISLNQVRLDFPAKWCELAAKYVLIAGNSIEGGEGALDPSLYTSSFGAGLTDFSEADFTDLPKASFPSAELLRNYGLGSRVYLNTASYTVLPGTAGVVIRGSGILIFRKSVEISPATVFEDRIVIYACKNLTIRDGVKLKKALIFCKGDVAVGDNCFVQGTIVAQGKIILGRQVQLIRDASAAFTYNSANFLTGT